MPGDAADDMFDAMMREERHAYNDDDDWERRAENELGLPYFPRHLHPAVRRSLIQIYRDEQIKKIAELAKHIALPSKP